MKSSPFAASFLVLVCAVQLTAADALDYPRAARGATSDSYFGTTVADPYRWMENLDAPQTTAWAQRENALARSFFDAVPQRNAIRERFRTLLNNERYSAPFRRGPRWYHTYNSGLQNQSVLYSAASPDERGTVFLDPNRLSADGTVSLGGTSFTRDGKVLAYTTQAAGSDVTTLHVRDALANTDLPDAFEPSRTSGTAWRDDDGFFYGRFPRARFGAAVSGAQIMYHRRGTAQAADTLVYERPDNPALFLSPTVTSDGNWLLITQSAGTSSRSGIIYKNLRTPNATFHELVAGGDAFYRVVSTDGARWYVNTEKNAPNGRLVWIDVNDTRRTLHDVLAERPQKLQGVTRIGDRFYAAYLTHAHSSVEADDLNGKKIAHIATPGVGTMSPPQANRDDTIAFYTYTSYSTPNTIYRYDTRTGASSVFRKPAVPFDSTQFVTEEVFAPSKDGTNIPLFITHRKDAPRDGSSPTILYAYGGFDIPELPAFSSTVALWLQMGGTYAAACLRGGNEYGEAWHEAGMLGRKQNVFDDFYGAARYLVANKYTSVPKLAASGGSNGGLLVGAAITQHPEMFGAALPGVGVMDMLRFQKFTVGAAWTTEYGSSEFGADQFKTLLAYSPYHNIKPGVRYPPTLVTTADHDDRVFPAHSFKFAAALQAAQSGDAPISISVETNAGHGGGKPISKIVDETADEYAFLVRSLNFTPTL
ncbi:MAG: prolyl oligopeptidase family protein [Candidatus Velthaea sp.]